MKKKLIPFLLLIAYVVILIKILVFKDLALIRIGEVRFNFGGTQEGPANLIPFKTIIPYLQGHNGLLIAVINIVGNIIALVPLGFLVPFVFPKMNWGRATILAIASGCIIEGMQVMLHVGIFDIDDVLLNGLGVLIGFGKFAIFSNFSKKAKSITSAIVFIILGTILSLYVLAYYKLIQLPIGIEPSIEHNQSNEIIKGKDGTVKCCDLCNGTGGTGAIISLGTNAITIKRRDGKDEVIKLTKATTIKTSAGPATNEVLKIGDRVTVIIDDTETASLVLVCGIK